MQVHKNGHTILVGEDELEVRDYLDIALTCLGYSVEFAQDGQALLTHLVSSRSKVSAVLLDLMMPHRDDGIGTLREIKNIQPNLPVIIVSGAATTLNIVTAMKCGAADFLSKPVAHDDLRKALGKALELGSTTEPAVVEKVAPRPTVFVANNPRMQKIQALAAHVGRSEAPVLIQGETGTGKEVFARELHAHSPRADQIFLKLNCAALPSELVESELFGYERGAFTGAFQKKSGMFETADGGTILLDEIGDMDVRLQAKLLQVLQDHEFQRIGGKEVIRVDVRILAATHRDLEKAMFLERTFREDLYYRLNVINVHLPALRDRQEDIIPLAEYFLKKHATKGKPAPVITLDLKHSLMSYHWPGNIRELENMIRKLMVLEDADFIARDLQTRTARKPLMSSTASVTARPHVQRAVVNGNLDTPILEQVTLAKHQAETEAILAALNSTRWNRKLAAARLKIDYKALLYKMKKLGVEDEAVPVDFAPDDEDQS